VGEWVGVALRGEEVRAFKIGSDQAAQSKKTDRADCRCGPGQTWDQAGNLRTRENSWLGTRHGVTEEWDEHGELALRRTYELGTLVGEMKWDQGVLTRDWQLGAEEESFQRLQQRRSRWGSEFTPM
jgi:hypothetical protein